MQFSMYSISGKLKVENWKLHNFQLSILHFPLSGFAPWQQNRKDNLLIQGLPLQLNEQLTAVSFIDLDLEFN